MARVCLPEPQQRSVAASRARGLSHHPISHHHPRLVLVLDIASVIVSDFIIISVFYIFINFVGSILAHIIVSGFSFLRERLGQCDVDGAAH